MAAILNSKRLGRGSGAKISIASSALIDRTALLAFPNAHPDIFGNQEERTVRIEEGCWIGPWCIIYDGAVLEENVIVDARSTIGSRTKIGRGSRVYYGAQVHDNVRIGPDCVIAGFVADNCRIGPKCSIFGDLIHRYEHPGVQTWDETDEQGPTLDEGVIVGWGAVLIGPIHVGARARIAPKAVVRSDVLEGQHVS